MIYTGSNEILGIKLGNTDISAIYAGDLLIYPTTVTGWSVSPSSFEVKRNPGNVNIRITSLSAWTIASSESWITFSQNSGASGRTTVVATYTENTGDSDRTATITVTDGTNTSTISVTQKHNAVLPSNTFLFNYNAKRYSSGVFAKEPGQLYDNDLQLSTTSLVTDYGDYVQFNNDSYETRHYTAAADNPFNRSSADSTFTFIYKTSGYSGQRDRKLFSNRQVSVGGQSKYDCHNYLIASNGVFGFSGDFAPSNNPQYMVIRAFSDNSGLRQEVDVDGNVLQSAATTSVGWDSPSAGIGFFTGGYGYAGSNECFRSNFYWMYCSNEALTDAEVLEVIKYNEEME